MIEFKVKLTALDRKPITPRTVVSSQEGNLVRKKITEDVSKEERFFIYWPSDFEHDSPGIVMSVNSCKKLEEDVYEFLDGSNRKFKIEYLPNTTFTINQES